MKKIFMLWLIIATLIPIGGAFAQSDGGKKTEYISENLTRNMTLGMILSSLLHTIMVI